MINFRKANFDDAGFILEWRNDERIRLKALSKDIIAMKDHMRWFVEILTSKREFLFIAEINNNPIGVLRFDMLSDDVAEVNFYLNPEKIGQGLGKKVLSDGVLLAKENFPKLSKIIAKIIPDNSVSIKVFEAVGFQKSHIQLEKIIC